MFKKRVITSLWGVPLLFAAVWFEQPLPWFTIIFALWGVLAVIEFYRLTASASVPAFPYLGIFLTLIFIISRNGDLLQALEPFLNLKLVVFIPLALTLVLPSFWLLIRPGNTGKMASWVWTIVGVIYIGWLLSHLVAMRDIGEGRNWVLFILFITFASDTAAFFTGNAIGRHKLAPGISPGKTWEGAIGGICGAVVVSLLFTLPSPLSVPIGWGQAIVLGLLGSLFGQLGDLVESLFKRRMGVKDSSNMVPGHGGFLDRLDSLLFGGAAVYYYIVFVIQ
ncbi:MAG: phosphatidate cytidylyltransferase [Dehalococcoidales bacterium]